MPEISVIVPVYKVEKYLNRCVDSILSQTFTDFELILVDDGSPDKCGEICEEYAKKDCRIHVIHRENGGLSAARNTGIDWANANSSSKWITFIDSDDLVTQNYLESMWKEALESNSQIVCCNCVEKAEIPHNFNDLKSVEFKTININEDTLKSLYYGAYVYWIACGKLVKKSIPTKYLFPIGRIFEDNPVVCKWLIDAKQISYTDSKLYFYFINPDGISKQKNLIKMCDFWQALNEQACFYESVGYHKMHKMVEHNYIIGTIAYLKKIYASQERNSPRLTSLSNELATYILSHKNRTAFSYREQITINIFLHGKCLNIAKPVLIILHIIDKLMFWKRNDS